MFAIFKKRSFLSILGLLLLAAFIWWAGPYFAFADYHPLGTVTARLVVIGVIIGLWVGSIFWKQFKAKRTSGKLVAAVVAQEKGRPQEGADARALRERFEEAVATLNKGSGPSLYELPWYVIIGAPGSGKTTALLNSGLNFPLAQRFGKEALRGIGGTRNCDWWFTDRAVLLDTAGRYTTQDSDQSADSAGWSAFLALIKKYRQRRPLNGVIVAVSASDLMTHTAAEREAHVTAVRRRLDEINRELRVKLPVYVLVTKTDLVAGFTEYFDDLTQEGRAQVWGVTFPFEQTTAGKAAELYPAELDALVVQLNARLYGRLEEARDSKRRAAIFGFPQQLAGMKDALTNFVREVFASTRFDQQSWLRGVYFTSGTQEGTPIDRLLGALGRAYASPAPAISTGKGKSYFIERLLRDVMFQESGLAGVNRRFELQKAAAQIGLYAALVLIAIFGVIAFAVSYNRNKTYVEAVAASVRDLEREKPAAAGSPIEQSVPRLNAIFNIVNVADRHREDVPLMMRWGLYQGRALGNAARDAYVRELDGTLLPKVGEVMQRRLIAYTAEPDKLYEYLKAYLMLGLPEHLDKAQLAVMTDLEWQTAYADQPDIREALSLHWRNLLQYEETLRALPLNEQLVAQARNAIQQASVPRLMYSRLKLKYAADERFVRLDVAAGLGAERVLTRKGGKPLSEPVPALYTPAVFNEISGLGTAELANEFAQDAWVFGDNSNALQSARVVYDVLDVYEQDYIRAWDEVLQSVQIAPFANLTQASEVLGILAAPNSPLRGLLVTVDQNTFLLKPPDPNAKPGAAAKAEQAVKARLDKLLGSAQKAAGAGAEKPGTQVTKHFDPIHKLVAGGAGQAPIDRVLAQLGQIQTQIASVGGSVGQTNPLEALSRAGGGESLKALQREAASLPQPIGAMVSQIGGRSSALAIGQARGELENRYRVQVLNECSSILGGRYPFDPRSAIDVPLADFGRLFGASGVFEAFFKENLAPLVDTSRTPWTWRPGASGSLAMLRQFEAAQRIRDQYFRPGGQLPEVRFNVTPGFLDAAASRFVLELDGQSFEYRHGPERSFPAVWPGPAPGVAAYSFEGRGGDRPNQTFQGPWAWFRLLDAGQLQPASDVRYTLSLQAGTHQARVAVEATSIRNPFLKADLRQFRCSL
jgi:type VI secretion system protein ImpL